MILILFGVIAGYCLGKALAIGDAGWAVVSGLFAIASAIIFAAERRKKNG